MTKVGYTIGPYRRISKRHARLLYAAGKPFFMCPANLRPGAPWHPECRIDNLDPSDPYPFESLVANFEYHNCDNERGRYPAYYVKE